MNNYAKQAAIAILAPVAIIAVGFAIVYNYEPPAPGPTVAELAEKETELMAYRLVILQGKYSDKNCRTVLKLPPAGCKTRFNIESNALWRKYEEYLLEIGYIEDLDELEK